MGSSFFELNIASTALFSAKSALEITSHNIANAATKGYSRQVALQRAATPAKGNNGTGMIGTGSEVYGVGQIRDFYLDKKYWNQTSSLGEHETKSSQLNLIETVFNELSDKGSSTGMINDFFNSLSSLSFSAGDDTYRMGVIATAETFATNINTLAKGLQNQQSDLNEDIYAVVQKINDLGRQITTLNKQIYTYEQGGSSANDLRDQRALLVDELSKYANVDVKERKGPSGGEKDLQYNILLNGQEFVDHFFSYELETVRREEKVDDDDAVGLYDIRWKHNKDPLNVLDLSGELKGLMDIRDGNPTTEDGINYKGIPYYIDKLSHFVQTIAKAMNEGTYSDGTEIPGMTGHADGYDAYGNQGGLFFSYKNNEGELQTDTQLDYTKMSAFNFCINSELKEDPKKLAMSNSADVEEKSNNEVVNSFVNLKDDNSLFKEGKMYDFVITISTSLGIDNKQATKFTNFYKDISSSTDNQRLQVSGVSNAEETVNIVKYQQVYAAAAKLISAINEIYNTTINGLGL